MIFNFYSERKIQADCCCRLYFYKISNTFAIVSIGPTSAAGALGGQEVIENYLKDSNKSLQHVDALIQENDSFNFYRELLHGKFHICTGHTGTNVMDLHLLYFNKE